LRGTGPRRICQAIAALVLAAPLAAGAAPAQCDAQTWPLWQEFQTRFIQPDGRVMDASTPQKHTSSEGQSYGMFFALVAGDRETFDQLWRWSVANLFAGDASARLPAWFWGLAPDGSWGVLDANSASDADLWFTFDLLEAARVWNRPDYAEAGRALLARIEREEVVDMPGLGQTMLPGMQGFVHDGGKWRLNASYFPLPVLRRMATQNPHGPWRKMAANSARIYAGASDTGWVADWIGYELGADGKPGFVIDPVNGDLGSYDAIRTYMWAGMTPTSDEMSKPLLKATRAMAQRIDLTGVPPEKVMVSTGDSKGAGSFGFSAALLPYLDTTGQKKLGAAQLERVQTGMEAARTRADAAHTQAPYYDYVISLFSLGWVDRRYRFEKNGSLKLSWEKACPRAADQ
jgi:endoglucanase